MPLAKGQIVELKVIFVTYDACWGLAGDLVGFVHHSGWSKQRPILESAIPRMGQTLEVQIIHVVAPGEELRAWATYDGKFRPAFAAIVREPAA